ncbi:hypothetical protein [Chelativorans xinjiangense]|uniref:hypothetical protein n=1 Tax=Chelativorans xinjiangense TaxID=2681485 RepID=UPI001FE72B36|nr:hypothetical protein [Chelativorans xinjiangense]
MVAKAHLVFEGRLQAEAFIEFAQHRADRLDLELAIDAASDDAVSLVVSGQPDLVDAFEMACSLGPYECIVLDVLRRHAA